MENLKIVVLRLYVCDRTTHFQCDGSLHPPPQLAARLLSHMNEEVLAETEQVHLLPLVLPFNLAFCKLAWSALHLVCRAALCMPCCTLCVPHFAYTQNAKKFLKGWFHPKSAHYQTRAKPGAVLQTLS